MFVDIGYETGYFFQVLPTSGIQCFVQNTKYICTGLLYISMIRLRILAFGYFKKVFEYLATSWATLEKKFG